MNKQDLRTLKTELTDDPEELGYAEKSHEELAAILNATQRNVERASFTGAMLVSCIDKAEYENLDADGKSDISLLSTANGEIPVTRAIRRGLKELFPAGSNTRSDIADLFKRKGTRAEELGIGSVTASDVADALMRTS